MSYCKTYTRAILNHAQEQKNKKQKGPTRGSEVKVVEGQHEEVQHKEHKARKCNEVWSQPCW